MHNEWPVCQNFSFRSAIVKEQSVNSLHSRIIYDVIVWSHKRWHITQHGQNPQSWPTSLSIHTFPQISINLVISWRFFCIRTEVHILNKYNLKSDKVLNFNIFCNGAFVRNPNLSNSRGKRSINMIKISQAKLASCKKQKRAFFFNVAVQNLKVFCFYQY